MKFDLMIFTTVTLSSDVVGVFRRNESVAVRGRVRAGGVQKLLDVHHGGGAAAGQARRRGSDGLAAGHRSSRAVNEILRNVHMRRPRLLVWFQQRSLKTAVND